MQSVEAIRPDWRDAAAYAPLLDADRALLAWEWLRRDAAYRRAARRHLEGDKAAGAAERPERWGLHAFEPPGLPVPDGRPVWRSDVYPYVLAVRAVPGTGGDTIELQSLAPLCRLVAGAGDRQHLLISDGLRSIRIDVVEGSIGRHRIRFHYLVAGFDSAEKPLLTLRRLLALRRTGHFSSPLHASETRARRFVLMLRAADALASGAVQREIAAGLLDPDARKDRWRVRSPSLRSRVQRLVGSARAMAAGGYWRLLRS
jgi:hypothetical protein